MGKRIYAILFALCVSVLLGYINEDNTDISHDPNTRGEMTMLVNNKSSKTGVSEESLFFNEPVEKPANTYIRIYKSRRVLELYGDDILIGRFKIGLGSSPIGDKTIEGDSKTPEGSYYICTRNENSKFTLFLGLNYPNTEDAGLALENNMISKEEYDWIRFAETKKQRPPWHTAMGGQVGIHGGGNTCDWTQGCIALSNHDILILGRYVTYKMPVNIYK